MRIWHYGYTCALGINAHTALIVLRVVPFFQVVFETFMGHVAFDL